MVLAANRNEEATPVNPQQIDQDVMEIYKATEGKAGTDELLVCNILTQRSDSQIRAIAHGYQQKFTRDLESVIKKVCASQSAIRSKLIICRNSLGTWNWRSSTNCGPELIKQCGTLFSSRTPWQEPAPKTHYSHNVLYALTGIALTCSRLRAHTSTSSAGVLLQESRAKLVGIRRDCLLRSVESRF